MKKKLIVLFLAAVMCLPLIACGGEKKAPTAKLTLSEYAEDVNYSFSGVKANPENSAYTQSRKLGGTFIDVTSAGTVILKAGNSDFRLFDAKNDAQVQEGTTMTSAPQIFGDVFIRSVQNGVTKLFDLTGKQTVLDSANYTVLNVDRVSYYLPGKYTKTTVYKLTYNTSPTEEDKIKYFTYESSDGIAEPVLTEIAESDLRTTSAMNVLGATVSAVEVSDIYTPNRGKTDNDLKGYGYGVELHSNHNGLSNFTTYFYNNGKQTGSVQVKNGYSVGFIGKYFYFAEIELMPYDAEKDYNVFIQSDSYFTSSQKLKVTYYRYDVLKNKQSKFDPGYFIMPDSVQPLYNNYKKLYNAAQLKAVNYVDGVATITAGTPYKTYFVNQDCRVGFDLTDKPFGVVNMTQLPNGNTFITDANGYYIVDKSLNIIASIPAGTNAKIYKNSGVITYRHLSQRYMAIDFNGNVVLNPRFNTLEFYGGIALTDITDGSASGINAQNVLVSASSKEATRLDIIGDGERLLYGSEGLLIKYSGTSKTLTVYNYSRDVIMTVPELNTQPQIIVRKLNNTDKAILTINNLHTYLLY